MEQRDIVEVREQLLDEDDTSFTIACYEAARRIVGDMPIDSLSGIIIAILSALLRYAGTAVRTGGKAPK